MSQRIFPHVMIAINDSMKRLVNGDGPSALLAGILPLHCVSTVDLWTHAVSTMAGACAATSCSSWQRMQVSSSLSAGEDPRWGPMATHSSLCSIAQLEAQTEPKLESAKHLRFRGLSAKPDEHSHR